MKYIINRLDGYNFFHSIRQSRNNWPTTILSSKIIFDNVKDNLAKVNFCQCNLWQN